ncbi:M15 family metallopeptidase [Ureibacillus acetophenoni]|uniref:D-alanyl-D-alanine dipeptidase n=1 Tax=Ureibacillus acetophenoni TaxID=614649 RepID=A0A285UKV8_9BACL|nr:M15 family metallopeptidase [Ureibacillus acetophenoni]SOC40881.1 D-alanyl-D-alanine dipeptidase [Ureibacillus acetophenoni]
MTRLLRRKNAILFPLLLALISLVTACSNSTNVEDMEDSKSVSESPEDKIPTTVQIPPPTPEHYVGDLELPVIGATGFTSVQLELKEAASLESETVQLLDAGTAFEILQEDGDWWFIQNEKSTGWVLHKYCFINLPDVIPSIIYDNTNTYSAKYVSSGKSIPNITGEQLYQGKTFNKRLGKEEFIVPVLYSMSKKIHFAQQYALADGNSLLIYEGYRPFSAQQAIVNELTKLAAADFEVAAGISSSPWSIDWFIATNVSNHQVGYAIDVSLAKVHSKEVIVIGNYAVNEITDYTEYTMPTPIHELSLASATFEKPVTAVSATAWRGNQLADNMNEAAINLQTYNTKAGLTPLASEWWHFNDLDALNEVKDNSSDGGYVLTKVYSVVPPSKNN